VSLSSVPFLIQEIEKNTDVTFDGFLSYARYHNTIIDKVTTTDVDNIIEALYNAYRLGIFQDGLEIGMDDLLSSFLIVQDEVNYLMNKVNDISKLNLVGLRFLNPYIELKDFINMVFDGASVINNNNNETEFDGPQVELFNDYLNSFLVPYEFIIENKLRVIRMTRAEFYMTTSKTILGFGKILDLIVSATNFLKYLDINPKLSTSTSTSSINFYITIGIPADPAKVISISNVIVDSNIQPVISSDGLPTFNTFNDYLLSVKINPSDSTQMPQMPGLCSHASNLQNITGESLVGNAAYFLSQ
jgi:hypothetical protein